jgi:hypothetical protein
MSKRLSIQVLLLGGLQEEDNNLPRAWMMKNLLLLAPTLVWFKVAS